MLESACFGKTKGRGAFLEPIGVLIALLVAAPAAGAAGAPVDQLVLGSIDDLDAISRMAIDAVGDAGNRAIDPLDEIYAGAVPPVAESVDAPVALADSICPVEPFFFCTIAKDVDYTAELDWIDAGRVGAAAMDAVRDMLYAGTHESHEVAGFSARTARFAYATCVSPIDAGATAHHANCGRWVRGTILITMDAAAALVQGLPQAAADSCQLATGHATTCDALSAAGAEAAIGVAASKAAVEAGFDAWATLARTVDAALP